MILKNLTTVAKAAFSGECSQLLHMISVSSSAIEILFKIKRKYRIIRLFLKILKQANFQKAFFKLNFLEKFSNFKEHSNYF